MKQEIKEKALGVVMKNPYWKGIYEGAPDRVKRLYELSFARSENLISAQEDKEETISLYGQFNDADWAYLDKHTENRMGKWGYKKAREKYGKKS